MPRRGGGFRGPIRLTFDLLRRDRPSLSTPLSGGAIALHGCYTTAPMLPPIVFANVTFGTGDQPPPSHTQAGSKKTTSALCFPKLGIWPSS